MRAFKQNGILYENVDIISQINRDVNGKFQVESQPQEMRGYVGTVSPYYGQAAESEDSGDYETLPAISAAFGPQAFNPEVHVYNPYTLQNNPRISSNGYGLSSLLSRSSISINHEPKKYRFIGDLHMYDTHWIGSNAAGTFITNNFGLPKSRLEYPKEKYNLYVCSKNTIKREFSNKIKTVVDENWDKIPEKLSKKQRTVDFYSSSRERAFCLGCAMNTNTIKRILMTAIDTTNNVLCVLTLDLDCARAIKNLYLKSKDKYDKIESWLYHNDLTISCEKYKTENNTEKKYTVEAIPTIYNSLQGEAYIIDHKSFLISMMHYQANKFNGYVGDCYHDFLIKRKIANKVIMNVVDNEAVFIDGSTGKEYHRYELPENKTNEISVEDMLEL